MLCTSRGMRERFHVYMFTSPRIPIPTSGLGLKYCMRCEHSSVLWQSVSALTPSLVYCAPHQGRVHVQALAPPSSLPRTPYRLVNNYSRPSQGPVLPTNNPVVVHSFRVCTNQESHSLDSKDWPLLHILLLTPKEEYRVKKIGLT